MANAILTSAPVVPAPKGPSKKKEQPFVKTVAKPAKKK